jgi:hypothetical protein
MFHTFVSVMSIIGRTHKQTARWTVTLSTEVPEVGIAVGKTEQAGRNLPTCIRYLHMSDIDRNTDRGLRRFRDMLSANSTTVQL